jgi:hypothetical protein
MNTISVHFGPLRTSDDKQTEDKSLRIDIDRD